MSKYIGATVVNLSVDTVDVTGDITATDSTPELILLNDTHEDTDGGREGKVTFKGEQSGGEVTVLAQIQSGHDGTSDDEKGELIFKTNDGNDGSSPSEVMRIDSLGNVGIGTDTIDVSTQAGGSGYQALQIESDEGGQLNFDHNDAGTGSTLGQINFQRAGEVVAEIEGVTDGATDNGRLSFRTQPDGGALTERMRIDHDGNVGIGTTAPLRQLHIHNTSSNSEIAFTAGTSGVSSILFGDGQTGVDVYRGYVQYNHSSDTMLLATTSTERMRIASNGDVMVTKSAVNTDTVGIELRSNGLLASTRDGGQPLFLNRLSSDGTVVSFAQTGSTKGSITISGSSTAYNTSSDYRLKENVTDVTDGITRVKQLAPKRFNFIVDADTTVDGFLAHEAQAVVPEAITGTKDEVEVWADGDELPDGVSVGDNKLDDDGKTIPVMQGIDQSKLVPLLTAALQEAIAKIETLETKVAALEGE